jgi:dolichyl-phosphate-mannose--protein O-mannosyl transferase
MQEPAPHTSGLSIAALVLGLLGIWPLAIIFGGIGISQTKQGRNVSGRGMAIAGLVLGIVVGAFWIGLFTWAFIVGFSHTNLPIIGGSSV